MTSRKRFPGEKSDFVLGIDPGINQGWAAVDEGVLRHCGLGECPYVYAKFVIIEKPQFYPGQSAKNANDLITLAISVGMRLAVWPDAVLVLPSEWKGSTPKDIHNRRVVSSLSPQEKAVLDAVKCAKSKLNNVIDAIGLAKYGYSGRKL